MWNANKFRQDDYDRGYDRGYDEGISVGDIDGYDHSYPLAYDTAYAPAYDHGFADGEIQGPIDGASDGYDAGFDEGALVGSELGFDVGYEYAINGGGDVDAIAEEIAAVLSGIEPAISDQTIREFSHFQPDVIIEAGGGLAVNSVPEPGSLTLVILGGVLLFNRRRR